MGMGKCCGDKFFNSDVNSSLVCLSSCGKTFCSLLVVPQLASLSFKGLVLRHKISTSCVCFCFFNHFSHDFLYTSMNDVLPYVSLGLSTESFFESKLLCSFVARVQPAPLFVTFADSYTSRSHLSVTGSSHELRIRGMSSISGTFTPSGSAHTRTARGEQGIVRRTGSGQKRTS